MTNYAAGHDAEKRAAEHLKSQGYKVIELNWRTRWCEIDIVAEKDKIIYFVEVKYRRDTSFGTGLDYVTPRKLKQMAFAAEFWVSDHDWSGDYRLAVLSLVGDNFEFIEIS